VGDGPEQVRLGQGLRLLSLCPVGGVMIVAPLNIDVCIEHSCTPIICDVYTNYL